MNKQKPTYQQLLNKRAVLAAAKKEYGVVWSARRLTDYEQRGIFPKPFKRPKRGGGMEAVYPPSAVEVVKYICDLQEEGYPLALVKKKMDEAVIEKAEGVYKELKFLHKKSLFTLREHVSQNIGGVVKTLKYWDPEVDYKIAVLRRVASTSNSIRVGITYSYKVFLNEVYEAQLPELKKDTAILQEKVNEGDTTDCKWRAETDEILERLWESEFIIEGVLNKLMGQSYDIAFVYTKANLMLAEIIGESEGYPADYWKRKIREVGKLKERWNQGKKNTGKKWHHSLITETKGVEGAKRGGRDNA